MHPRDTLIDAHALVDATPPSALPRRRALGWGLGLGWAAAALPTLAQTAIRTPTGGLTVGEVSIDVGGGQTIPAYRAQPAGKKNLPTVLVISEIFGVHAHIADLTHRLARAGYLAVAPELFIRQGDPQSYGEIGKLIAEVIAKVPDAQVTGDLDATAAWAAAHGGDGRRLAVTGFCWGGRQTWLYAAHNPRVKAAVAWYGRLEGETHSLNPRHPVDVAAELKAPVLGLYGGQDSGIGLDTVARMQDALARAGAAGHAAARDSRFVVYREAPHAFHADYRATYREADARDGWKRMLAWFAAHGVAA